MRNSPAAIYLGCVALAVGVAGLALHAPAAHPSLATAQAKQTPEQQEPLWPPANASVAFVDEWVDLQNFAAESGGRALRAATAEAMAARASAALSVPDERAPRKRATLGDLPTGKKHTTITRRRNPRSGEDTADVVIRDGRGYRTLHVPRERDDEIDVRRGYAPEEPAFWGRW